MRRTTGIRDMASASSGQLPAFEALESRLLLAADVILSEIMYQSPTEAGDAEDYGEEFIELHNRGDAPADLLGWRFADGVSLEFPDVSIGAGEYLVVPANPGVFQTLYPGVTNFVDAAWDGHLSNSGEQVELEDDLGTLIDRVEYADEGDWSFREWVPDEVYGYGYAWSNLHDGGGYSLELINPAMTNNAGLNWAASTVLGGTPGGPNSIASTNIAPLIRDVSHDPIIPTASQAVTVTAEIDDELTTGLSVVLHYRDDGDPGFSTAVMHDDGLNGDEVPNDGVYVGEIPERPDGTIVEFYVEATDADTNTRQWPRPVANLPPEEADRTANCLYQVDDSFTEDWTPGDQAVWRVIMTDQEWLELDDLEDDHRDSNAQRNATFVSVDGVSIEARYEVGIRHRGNGSRGNDPHNQRLNLPHDRPWEGYKAMTLNTLRTHSQVIASAVFRYADIPAADTVPVQLLINGVNHADTDMYGSYAYLEALDSDMVSNHWPDDSAGDLYKCNDSNGPAAADLDYDGEDPDNYNIAYAKQTNVAVDDYSGLIHMLDVLNNAPDETYVEDVAEVVNIEQWVRFLAVDTLLANGEGGLTDGRGDDYAMYQGVIDPRFTLVPYDLDTTVGTGSQSQTDDDIWEYRDPGLHGLERLLSQPEVIQMYYATLLELADTVFAPETINPLIDQALGGWVTAGEIADIKQFVAARVANVRTQVADDPLSVQSSLPLVGGYPYTTDQTVGLSGTASGAHTRSVLLNGRLAEWNPDDGTWWFDDGAGSYQEQTLVGSDAAVTYHVPTVGEDPTAWTEVGFDDSGWVSSINLDAAEVLITEIATGDVRFVEVQNVAGQGINTTGWQVLVNDASSGISVANSVAWSLPASMVTGQVLYQSDDLGDNYWGATIDWGAVGPGWAMIINESGEVRDFVAWGYTAAEIASMDVSFSPFPSITVGDQWSGDGAPVGTTDIVGPTADIVDVLPDPRNSSVSEIQIDFSEAVTGFDLGDLALTLDGGANLLTGAQTLASGDDIHWTLGNLAGITGGSGTHLLTLTAAGSNIEDGTGNPLAGDATDSWLTDADAPTADVIDVAPDPHNSAVASVDIVFSEAVSGLDLSDLTLTRDGGGNLLTGAQSVSTSDNITWTLTGLGAITTVEGMYTLTLTAAASDIEDAASNPLAGDASDTWEIVGVAPTADVVDVTPDPRTTAVSEIQIVFSEPVTGFDISDLSLTLDGGANLLTAEPLTSGDNITWTLGNLSGITETDGTYTLTLTAVGSNIQDAASNPLAGDASDSWVKNIAAIGWVAFNDHLAGTGTHANATTYAGNGTASGELLDITTGLGTGATLTITDTAIVYDNNGDDPPAGSDAYNVFNGFVDFGAATGSSIEVEGALGASYTHAFSGLDTGDAATYSFTGTSIRGSNTYTNRWTLITLQGADSATAAHSTGDGVVVVSATEVAIWAGDNASPGQGWVAAWSDIDPGADGAFSIVSTQYTGSIPVSVDPGGVADGAKTYGVVGVRLEEVAAAPAPGPSGPVPLDGEGGFVAYNDHITGGGTHPNTTDYSAMSGEVHSGLLKNIADGTDTGVTLTVTDAGINYAGSQGDPALGTDAYDLFDGYVDFGSATGASIEVNDSDHYTYTFTGLDTGAVVTYDFRGTAIRSNSDYTTRWTLVTLVGADSFTLDHSVGEGVVTSAFNPSLGANQVAIWTGDNSQINQGYVAGWTDIDPGADGEFAVVSEQYTGAIPTSVDAGGVADGSKGYGISGIRLEEIAPSGPMSWLKRMGNTDGNDADDFARTSVETKGTQNPDLSVPFGTVIPTTMGIGFSDNQPSFDAVIETDVGEDMEGVNASLWCRIAFSAGDLTGYDTMTLRMKYDDGFVVYLNGTEVARRNADNPVAWNTVASAEHDNAEAVVFEDIDISAFLGELIVGTNVLAIHGQNLTAADADLLLQTELKVSRGQQEAGLGLSPGLNRVVVEAYDGVYGTGNKVDETHIDIWSDTGVMNDYPEAPPAGEGAQATHISLIVRDSYLPGEPVLVRVEALDAEGNVDRELWDATADLSADNGIGLDVTQITMFNGLGSALVTFTGAGAFNLTADVNGMQDSDDLTDLTGSPVTTVSGTLSDASGTDTWSGIIHVTGDVLVPAGHVLAIDPGTLIRIDGVASGSDGADIDVQGEIRSLGTEDQPITFTAYDAAEAWGEIHHSGADPSLYQYTNIIIAGNSPGGGHTGAGPAFRPEGSTIVFEHVNITDNAGKVMQSGSGSDLTFRDCILARSVMGPEIDNTALLFEDSWITENHGPDDNDGIYIHSQSGGQDCLLRGGVIADMHDDGLDTLHATVSVEDYIFRNMADKGISVYGGEVTLDWVLSINNDIGISAKDGSHAVVYMDHATITGNRLGIQAENKDGGMPDGLIEYFVTHSIVYAHPEWAVRSDYELTPIQFGYSNVGNSWISDGDYRGVPDEEHHGEVWPGTGNLNADPLFIDAVAHDYRLQMTSPSINTGDPAFLPLDDDGSTTDQGRFTNNAFTIVEGELTGNTIWRPEDGQYRVVGQLTVPSQYSLTIEPGTTVFFGSGASLIVRGPLYAEGTAEEPIRFAPTSASISWDGIQFVDNMNDNVISHAILGGVHRVDGMIELDNSNLTVDGSHFENADRRRIASADSSLIVRNSTFADFAFAGTPPNNVAEHIWGGYLPAGGHMVIENNVFGLTQGHNDAIDFNAGSRPDPIPQILNNTFLGGGDDALDLEGDFHIEGNVFMHYRKDADHAAVDGGESNVISAGTDQEYVVVGNVFYDCDHVALIKEGAFMTFLNNTVVGVSQGPLANLAGAIYFDLPGQVLSPGEGAYVEGSVFAETDLVFNNIDSGGTITDLTVHRSMLPAVWHVYGTGNLDDDPRVADPAGGDFSLANGSPAIGTGPVGLDMGAGVAAGALVSPMPLTETYLTDATFQTAGDADPRHNAILAFKYRLNGAAWSAEQVPGTPIALTGLGNGPQLLEVIAQNSAGDWQDAADAVSRAWTVDTALSRVLINEVLARNVAAYDHELTYPDVIELYNDSLSVADLAGWSITDNVDEPDKFVFAPGTTIAPGGYLTLWGDDATTPTSGIHLDFALKVEGDDVWLFDDLGAVVDSVVYGLQIPDLSIGRIGADRHWALTQPTIDPTGAASANVAQPTADPDDVLINEWFANGDVVLVDDFVELYNPDTLPVSVAGLYVTDNPANQKTKYQIVPLSFIAAEGFQALTADDQNDPGHTNFKLRAKMEILGLFDAGLGQMDRIYYTQQTEDVSQGRTPDGSETIEFFTLPTPGVGNVTAGTVEITTETLVTETDVEYVLVPTGDIGTTWRTDLVYDTTGWHVFEGTPPEVAVGWDSGDGNYNYLIGLDLVAEMDNINPTCYIRIPFTYSGNPAELTALTLNARYDDGFIAYLNGEEMLRVNFDPGDTPQWNSPATQTHSDGAAVNLLPFDVTDYIDELDVGDNLLAIHALNAGASSSDFLMSFELVATIETPIVNPFTQLLAMHNDLRITELMYNPPGSDAKEFVELKNTGTTELQLAGLRFTDGVDFVFPEMTLGAGEYVVMVRDLAEFQAWYGMGVNAVGSYDPDALSNSGEDILLQMPEPYDAAILRFDYDDGWYPSTDGDGASLVIVDPLGRRATWDDAEAWYPSGTEGGSPGEDDPIPQWPLGSVVVNEVLAHSDDPDRGDWIELHNTTGADIDISGWFLSDDVSVPQKFVIPGDPSSPFDPGNTILPAGGYIAFNQLHHFGVGSGHPGSLIGFGLQESGDEVILAACDLTGALSTYRDSVSFGATANSVTLGRHTLSTGRVDFVAMKEPDPDPEPDPYKPGTYGYANAGPLVGPMVIEEIMYHPVEGGHEYLLLRNISGSALTLYDPARPENTWKIMDGVDFVFPQADVVVPADDYVLITDVQPATYLATHDVPANVQVFGPIIGALSNGGETVTLAMPGVPDGMLVPYITVESVKYRDAYPWPESPDGDGPALTRLVSADYGNEPLNWTADGAPVVTVQPLVTSDTTPELTGTVTDAHPPATVTVTVNGADYVVPVVAGTWTLPDDTIAPLGNGTYDVQVVASDLAGNAGYDTTVDELVVELAPEVVARHIFYNRSAWDGNNAAANANDDGAIAPDPTEASDPWLGKTALLPGGTATFQNYTSYSRGINGIMIDVESFTDVLSIDQNDFEFHVGNSSDPSGWGLAPAPVEIAVREAAGEGGSDRITIIWADNTIEKQWLQVTVKATASTGLASPDVFYWGNAIGETGNDPANAYVNSADRLATRANPHNFFDPAGIDDAYDFDRDKNVNSSDRLKARANTTTFFTALKLITAPTAPAPVAPPASAPLPSAPLAASQAPSDLADPLAIAETHDLDDAAYAEVPVVTDAPVVLSSVPAALPAPQADPAAIPAGGDVLPRSLGEADPVRPAGAASPDADVLDVLSLAGLLPTAL